MNTTVKNTETGLYEIASPEAVKLAQKVIFHMNRKDIRPATFAEVDAFTVATRSRLNSVGGGFAHDIQHAVWIVADEFGIAR